VDRRTQARDKERELVFTKQGEAKMIYRESAEQQALFRWAALLESKYPPLGNMFAIPNGGKRNLREAARMKKEGVRAGVPDIFLAWAGNGRNGLFIEMKASKGRLTDKQTEWMINLLDANFQVEVCFSWVEAANVICKYLNIDMVVE
jgi:hypothetical protein